VSGLHDDGFQSFVYALLAVTSLKVEEETEEALRNANKALEIAEEIQSFQGLILSNYALGEAYNFKHNFKEAIHHFEVAADLAEKYRLLNILISSQAGLVQSYINTDDYQSAIRYGKLALNNAERIENNEIKFNLYKNIALSYAHLGRHDSAYYYSTIALDEYLYKVNEDNQRIIQEYLVKYETEKKENLILKQDRDLRQKQNWILLLSSVIILGLIGFVFYRKYIHLKTLKLKEEKEKEVLLSIDLGERKERKRLSRELHDGVASQLTAVKLLLESGNPTRQSQKALEVIKEVQKEIRDVAYSILPVDFERVPLHQAIRKFCYQISIPELKVHFFSNVEELELEKTTAHSLYRAAQEIIQNAIKHAQANSIHVQFIEKSGELEISIEDNGLGFDTEILNQENTLRFLIDRLSLIDARLEVESFPNQGAVFNITKKLSK
jgi:signal transduction histidine kinase